MGGILDQDIKFLPGVGPQRKALLAKELGIETYADLLAYYPYKYVDRSKVYPIRELNSEMPFVQVKGRILSFEQYDMGGRKKRLVAHFSDGTGVVDLVWFTYVQHAQKTYKIGVEYVVFGRPGIYGGRFQFAHPEMEGLATPEPEEENAPLRQLPESKMLIVEDNDSIREMLANIFKPYYHVLTAADGAV